MSKNYSFKKAIFKLSVSSLVFVSYSVHAQRTSLTANEQIQYQKNIETTIKNEELKTLAGNSTQRGTITPAPVLMADTDNDGMSDSWETTAGLNPNDPKDAFGDLDNDKVLNLFEFQLNSNPNSSSSPSSVNVPVGGNVAAAIAAATPGQLIKVQSGSYFVNYMTFTPQTLMIQGGWNSAFTSRNPLSAPTIFDGNDIKEVLYFSFSSGNNSVVVDGIELTHANATQGAMCFIMQGTAIGNLSMIDCKIDSSQTKATYGALHMFNWDNSSSENFIIRTAIVNDSSSGIYNQCSVTGNAKWHLLNTTISNNKSVKNTCGYGIRGFTLGTAVANIDIKNSIIWGNQLDAINFSKTGGPINITASYSNFDNVSVSSGGTYTPGIGMINANPLFVSTATSNFNLSAGSPCINSGINIGLPFNGVAPEMGAYEYSGVGINEYNYSTSIVIAPNPFNSQAVISFSKQLDNATLKIVDVLGREVKSIQFTGNNVIIEKENIPVGVYFVQIHTDNGIEAIEKVVVQ